MPGLFSVTEGAGQAGFSLRLSLFLAGLVIVDDGVYPFPGHGGQAEDNLLGQSVAQLLPKLLFLALLGEYVGFVVAVGFAGIQVGAGNQRDPVSREQFNGDSMAQKSQHKES